MTSQTIVHFSAKCLTQFGQSVVICGNIPELGNWEPAKGFKLYTNEMTYPYWENYSSIRLQKGIEFEFKLVVINEANGKIRWESLPRNRPAKINENCSFEITESIPQQIIKSRTVVQPVRKNTAEILLSLEGDQSSDEESYWEQVSRH